MLIQKVDGPTPSGAPALEGVGMTGVPRKEAAPVQAAPPAEASAVPVAADEARAAAAHANRTIQAFTQALEFEIDADTKKLVIRLVDTQDGRVLRQVPAPEMLEIARGLDRMQTLLVRAKA